MQNVTVPLLGLVDVAIAGHIGDARTIGAIAVGSMIFNVAYWLCGFLRMGTSGLTAQELGSKGSPVTILRCSLGFGLAVGLAFLLLQVPLQQLSFWLMRPTPDVAARCLPYFFICIWGAPAVLGLYALTGWFIGMQDTRTPMMVAIAQNLVNILASLCFVFLLGMDIEGIALGTLVAQWAGFVLASVVVLRTYRPYRTYKSHKTHKSYKTHKPCGAQAHRSAAGFPWRRFFSVNRDIFFRTLCLVAVNLYFTSAGAAQGAQTLAVNTLLMQLFTLFSYFMDGFAYAGEALAGRYYGARDARALSDVVRRLFRWGTIMMVLFTVAYLLGGTTLLRLLTSDASVIAAARGYLPWTLLIPLCGMAAFVWDGIFVGTTYTRGMLLSCLVAAAAFFFLWLALSPVMGNHALWLALLAYLALRGIVQSLLWPFFLRRMNGVAQR